MRGRKMASERISKILQEQASAFPITENADVPGAVGRRAVLPVLASPSATRNAVSPHAAARRAWCALNGPQSREPCFLAPSTGATACLPRSNMDHLIGTVVLPSVVQCAVEPQSIRLVDRYPIAVKLYRLTNSTSVRPPKTANITGYLALQHSLRYLR